MDNSERRFAFIGCGNMAGALIRALDLTGAAHDGVWLYDSDGSKYAKFADDYNKAASAAEAADRADLIFLCVKPQNYADPLCDIRAGGVSLAGKTIVSIVTGISCERIQRAVGCRVGVIRTMPNTPLLCGLGVTAVYSSPEVDAADSAYVRALLSSIGSVIELEESAMCDIIAETSSSPAYVYLFIKAIADRGVSYGFEREEITRAVCNTFIGAATLLRDGGLTPEQQIKMVTSPGGTTERAMAVLEGEDICGIIARAMDACTARAHELSDIGDKEGK